MDTIVDLLATAAQHQNVLYTTKNTGYVSVHHSVSLFLSHFWLSNISRLTPGYVGNA